MTKFGFLGFGPYTFKVDSGDLSGTQGAMTIKQLVERVLLDNILTADVEEKINLLLWSNHFDAADLRALDELVIAMQRDAITVSHYTSVTLV